MNFYSYLIIELLTASTNNYSPQENYDQFRFGKLEGIRAATSLKGKISKSFVRMIQSKGYSVIPKDVNTDGSISKQLESIEPYMAGLEYLYNLLADEASKSLLLQLVAFRILGLTKVMLPVNTPDYWNGIKELEDIADENQFVKSRFMDWKLPLFDLNKKGIPVRLYFQAGGLYVDFLLKQYELKVGSKTIKAEKGDFVVDAGGCWGDTALYFANEVGEQGRVFTYEFIPSNLEILKTNLALNPDLQKRVSLIEKPVWESSGEVMYYIDNGPGSTVYMEEPPRYDGKTSSLSIDDMVEEYSVAKIDFIKMDIEGAEPNALKGALKTIRTFKPKLAIAIYHSMSDFINIPKFIHELGLGYELHLAHCSIHLEESIIFAEIPAQK